MDPLKSSAQLEKLKCAQCKKSLSYFPIKSSCENGQNICGRCSVPEETLKYFHNEAYETAACLLAFPCRYKNEGCDVHMFPEEVPNHEKICLFQVVTCPVKQRTNCDWEGSLLNVLQHCKRQHSDLLLQNGEFELDVSESGKFESFMEYEQGFVITTSSFSSENSSFQFNVRYFEHAVDIKRIWYQISFKNKNKCLLMDGYATVFNKGEEEINEINLDSLKNEASDLPKVFIKFTLEKADQGPLLSEKQLNDEMLSQLKCATCSEYVMPPIYQNDSLVWCADCNVIGTRNLKLDKLANLLNYPCKYRKNGCTFVAKPDNTVLHEKFCLKGTYDCPVGEYLDCKWQGPGEDISTHLHQNHSDIIITNSVEITENCTNSLVKAAASSLPLVVTSSPNVFTVASSIFSPIPVGIYGNASTDVGNAICTTEQPFCFSPRQPISISASAASTSKQQTSIFGSIISDDKMKKTSTNSCFNFAAATTPSNKVQNSPQVSVPTTTSETRTTGTKTGSADSRTGYKEPAFEKCYVIPFLNNLFRLSFAITSEKYYWAVQMIGNVPEKFKYELEIVDKKDRDRGLATKQRCSLFTKKNEIFLDKRHYCSFSVDDIKLFLSSQDVTFKVQIVK